MDSSKSYKVFSKINFSYSIINRKSSVETLITISAKSRRMVRVVKMAQAEEDA